MSTAAGLLGLGIGQTAMRFVPAHLERGEYGDALRLVRLGGIILRAVEGGALNPFRLGPIPMSRMVR